jgi:hypothetical protein
MTETNGGQTSPQPAKSGFWSRFSKLASFVSEKFTYIIGLPIVTVIGTLLAAHFQYVSAYQDKVRAVGAQEVATAEAVFTETSSAFSKAITLQQILYFNYHDAITSHRETDQKSLELKNARSIFPQYEEARTSLRENIDLLTRRVELAIDWASDTKRDAAHAGSYSADPMSRIKLGAYNFDCDSEANMPTFSGNARESLQARDNDGRVDPKQPTIDIDWFSAKHQLLTLFYCFDLNDRRIKPAREWTAGSTPAPSKLSDEDIIESLDREALRLQSFLVLVARQIEVIRVKFRPSVWYCNVPIVRQIYDAYSKKCAPIHTAQNTLAS